jgi:hypothetical protein
MRLRHSITGFFAVIYSVLLLALFAISHLLQSTLLVKLGNMLGVMAFAAALQLSVLSWAARYPSFEGLSPIGLKHYVAQNWVRLCCTVPLIAVALQVFGYALASYIFKNEVAFPDAGRLALLLFVHAALAAAILNWDRVNGKRHERP